MPYYSLQLAIKGTPAILPQRLRDSDAFQRSATFKGTLSNNRHRLRDSDAFQRTAIFKGIRPNGGHWLGDSDVCQIPAKWKGILANGRHRLRDGDPLQWMAICKGTSPNGRHRLMDCDACQILAICKGIFPNNGQRLRNFHLHYLIAPFKGCKRNFLERRRDVDLQKALCMDCLFCCCFNFVSAVNDSHFGFVMQQPRRLKCLIIIYWQSVGQDLYYEDLSLNGIFTMLLFMKHCLQFFNGVSWHDFNGDHTTFQGLHFHFARHGGHGGCKSPTEMHNLRPKIHQFSTQIIAPKPEKKSLLSHKCYWKPPKKQGFIKCIA